MLPWGHAALGYLLYSAWRRFRFSEPPTAKPVMALLVGTQVPDLVDKPLSWTLSILPSGRSLGHSLLVVLLVATLVLLVVNLGVSWLRSEPMANGAGLSHFKSTSPASPLAAFFVGWASHLLGDSWVVLVGFDDCATYLLWPVLTICKYPESDRSILEFLMQLQLTFNIAIGLLLSAIATVVWIRDGTPGLGLMWVYLRRVYRSPRT